MKLPLVALRWQSIWGETAVSWGERSKTEDRNRAGL